MLEIFLVSFFFFIANLSIVSERSHISSVVENTSGEMKNGKLS